MGIEIERKFLVTGNIWRNTARPIGLLRQGYLDPAGSGAIVRIRCHAERAFLTIKGPREGIVRAEFEYEIPASDAEEMLRTLCLGRTLEKIRYSIEAECQSWTVDEFQGANFGLVVAEIELTRPDQVVNTPSWVGEEITGRHKYRNLVLAGCSAPSDTRPKSLRRRW